MARYACIISTFFFKSTDSTCPIFPSHQRAFFILFYFTRCVSQCRMARHQFIHSYLISRIHEGASRHYVDDKQKQTLLVRALSKSSSVPEVMVQLPTFAIHTCRHGFIKTCNTFYCFELIVYAKKRVTNERPHCALIWYLILRYFIYETIVCALTWLTWYSHYLAIAARIDW